MAPELSINLPDNIRLFTSPDWYEPIPGEETVFLGGGIPNVPPWHRRAIRMLARAPMPLAILNPCRDGFPVGDQAAVAEQVRWEYQHLHQPAGMTLFWFGACDPAVTVQPTTLLELGMALGEQRLIAIGADPGYPRRDILVHQLAQRRGTVLRDTLPDTVTDAVSVLANLRDVDLAEGWMR